jgi:predicted nuclease of predicted toxin-antitoxin system
VKLLFDENLSLRLASSLSDLYPESAHVQSCNLGSADDDVVWQYAKIHGYTIVSKDSDFAERSVLENAPPKVIWIRLGNCSTLDVERLLRSAHHAIRAFMQEDRETCLLLSDIAAP